MSESEFTAEKIGTQFFILFAYGCAISILAYSWKGVKNTKIFRTAMRKMHHWTNGRWPLPEIRTSEEATLLAAMSELIATFPKPIQANVDKTVKRIIKNKNYLMHSDSLPESESETDDAEAGHHPVVRRTPH